MDAVELDHAAARRQMVDAQLRPNRVLDPRLLAAMAELRREMFVPERLASIAYVDEDIEIAPGRYLLEPRVFGRLLQELAVAPNHRILDVGAGTGYSTAVLARLGEFVTAVEVEADLATQARRALARLGVLNASVTVGPLSAGALGQGLFDRIFVGGAVEEIPDALRNQLADGGRLGAVLRRGGIGKATLVERHGLAFGVRELFDAATPVLPGFARPKGFVF